jgi:hypothetical protein
MMDHGFLAIAVAVLFLDDSLGFRLVLLDYDAVAVTVTMLADGHAGAARAQAIPAANRYFFISILLVLSSHQWCMCISQ